MYHIPWHFSATELIYFSYRLLHVTIMSLNWFLSSCSSTIWLLLETFIFFPQIFHVWSSLFFIRDQRLLFPNLMRSFAKLSNSFWPISLSSKIFFLILLSITPFVVRLKRLLLFPKKGFVKFFTVAITCSVFLSPRNHRSWHREDDAYLIFPCSRAWSTPKAQNVTCRFMLTNQLPSTNYSYISGSVTCSIYISVRYSGINLASLRQHEQKRTLWTTAAIARCIFQSPFRTALMYCSISIIIRI